MLAKHSKHHRIGSQVNGFESSSNPLTTLPIFHRPPIQSLSKTQPITLINPSVQQVNKKVLANKPSIKKQQIPAKNKLIVLQNDDVRKIIDQSQSLIKNNQAIQGINLLKAMRDPSFRIEDVNLNLVILMNLAVAYYQIGFLEQAYDQFQILIAQLKQAANQALSAGKFHKKLKFSTLHAKIELQICILFSQMGKHDQALKHSKKACKLHFELVYDIFICLCKDHIKKSQVVTNERSTQTPKAQNSGQNLLNNVLLLQHLHKQVCDLNQIFHVPQKIKQAKDLLLQIKKSNFAISSRADIDLLYNQSQSSFMKLEWIYRCKILDQIQMKSIEHDFFDHQEESIPNQDIVQKITYLAISFYCYSTEIRFIQKTQGQNQHNEVMDSQHWLSRSLQIAYSFMPHQAPILNQILTVHDRFHGIDKQTIPQDQQVRGYFKVLKPLSKPKSIVSSKSHMISPIMIRIQAPKLTINIEKSQLQRFPKSTGKIHEFQQRKNIIDLESLTKNNKIKGLGSGIKILEFTDLKTQASQKNRISKQSIKMTSRSTISNLSSLSVDQEKKKRSKIQTLNDRKQSLQIGGQKYRDFQQDSLNMRELEGKAILSQDLLHRPHSYDKNINKWQHVESVHKGYSTQKRRKSLPSKNKQRLQKIVYNGSFKLDGLKLTGKRVDQSFNIDTSFLDKLNQAHNNQQAIQKATSKGGNIYINNNINLFISKDESKYFPQAKTARDLTIQGQMSKRQKFINKRRMSHLNVYPESLQV